MGEKENTGILGGLGSVNVQHDINVTWQSVAYLAAGALAVAAIIILLRKSVG